MLDDQCSPALWRPGSVIASVLLTICPASAYGESLPDRAAVLAQVTLAAERITGKPPNEHRYTASNCVPGGVASDSPLWHTVLAPYRDLPVQDCAPVVTEPATEGGKLAGRALLLLPTAAQVAQWIVSACEAHSVNATALRNCAMTVLRRTNIQNGLQFVIAGVITEPNEYGFSAAERANPSCAKRAAAKALYSFRDGITVRLQGQAHTSIRAGIDGGCRPRQPDDLDALIAADPAKVADFGRIAGLSRSLYSACTKQALPTDTAWRNTVSAAMVAAWHANRYSMMDIVARAIVAPEGACKLAFK